MIVRKNYQKTVIKSNKTSERYLGAQKADNERKKCILKNYLQLVSIASLEHFLLIGTGIENTGVEKYRA